MAISLLLHYTPSATTGLRPGKLAFSPSLYRCYSTMTRKFANAPAAFCDTSGKDSNT